MQRLKLLNQRQDEAVESWEGIGTINAAVGFGKNFTAFKCILKAHDKGWIKTGDTIVFFAETTAREATLIEELEKYKDITKVDLNSMFDIQFYCYQSVPNVKRELDIYDEIHDALTPKYKVNIEKGAKYKIGLSATIPKNSNLYKSEIVYKEQGKVFQSDKERKAGDDSFINKGQLLDQLCPICFTYTLSQGIEEGILSKFETTVIEHSLDKTVANIKTWKSKKNIGTEEDYYNQRAKLKSNFRTPSFRKMNLGKEMSQFLWTLPSKVEVTKNLLDSLEGKTIVFGTRLDHLELITPNVVRGKSDLVERFNNDEIDVIASSKKLKQGVTLKGVENCVIVSYFSTFNDIVQQLGRIVRFVEGKTAKLYIIITLNTLEEKWFKSMQEIYDEKGKLEGKVDLNIKYYQSSKTWI